MNYLELITASELHNPKWLWLIAIPFVSLLVHTLVSKHYLPSEYFDSKMSYWYLNHNKTFLFSNKKQIFISILFWLFFSVSLAGPEYPQDIKTDINSKGDSILILLDISVSMNTRDEQPTRLFRAKSELLLLVEKLKQGDKLGIMLFAGSPHLLFPPTSDKSAMRFYIQKIKPNILPLSGSLFGKALKSAQDALIELNNDPSSNSILLISDGDIEDESLTIKNINKLDLVIPIYALGIGQTIDSPVPSPDNSKEWITLKNGGIATSNRNDNFLKQITDNNNGKYSVLIESERDLDIIYSRGIKNKKEPIKSNLNWIQLYHPFLLISIILFFYQRILKSGY